jgi:hypothetical protein
MFTETRPMRLRIAARIDQLSHPQFGRLRRARTAVLPIHITFGARSAWSKRRQTDACSLVSLEFD